MNAVEFCFWLQGAFEMFEPETLNAKETTMIRKHLALAFKHDIDRRYPRNEQETLNNIHSGAGAAKWQPGLLSPETDAELHEINGPHGGLEVMC